MGNHKGTIYKSKVWVVEDKHTNKVLFEFEGKISELLYWFYLEYPDNKRYKLQTFKKHFNVYSKRIDADIAEAGYDVYFDWTSIPIGYNPDLGKVHPFKPIKIHKPI